MSLLDGLMIHLVVTSPSAKYLQLQLHFPVLDVNIVSWQFQKVKNLGVTTCTTCGSSGLLNIFPNELATVFMYIFQESILRSEIPCL